MIEKLKNIKEISKEEIAKIQFCRKCGRVTKHIDGKCVYCEF